MREGVRVGETLAAPVALPVEERVVVVVRDGDRVGVRVAVSDNVSLDDAVGPWLALRD